MAAIAREAVYRGKRRADRSGDRTFQAEMRLGGPGSGGHVRERSCDAAKPSKDVPVGGTSPCAICAPGTACAMTQAVEQAGTADPAPQHPSETASAALAHSSAWANPAAVIGAGPITRKDATRKARIFRMIVSSATAWPQNPDPVEGSETDIGVSSSINFAANLRIQTAGSGVPCRNVRTG